MDADADAPEQPGTREPVLQRRIGQLAPRFPPVSRPVQAASGTAATEEPGLTQIVVHAGIHDLRILRIEGDVAGAGRLVDEQSPLPGRATVGGSEDAALAVRTKSAAQGGGNHHLRIRRVDCKPREPLGLLQPKVFPAPAAVSGLVDAVAERDAVADSALARADIDDVGFVGLDGDGTNREGVTSFENRIEGHPPVDRLVETR